MSTYFKMALGDGLEPPAGISPLGINSAMSATNSTTRECFPLCNVKAYSSGVTQRLGFEPITIVQ